jgi:hypothetical protein
MKMKFQSIVPAVLGFLLFPPAHKALGQQLESIETSNYAGINGVHLNPSSMADSRWGGMVQLGTGAALFAPNPVGIEPILFRKERPGLGSGAWGIREQDLRGPGVMFQLRPRHAFAFTTRYRSDVTLTNGTVANWFSGSTAPVATQNFGLTTNTFTEYGLSYAASVLDIDKHFLKVGATVKLFRGLQTGRVAAAGTFATTSTGLSYNLSSVNYQYSDVSFTEKFSLTDWLIGKAPGSGLGTDLGLTYEFRPQHELYRYPLNGKQVPDVAKTKYRLRVGLALLDLGSINYNDMRQQAVANKTGVLQQRDFASYDNTAQYLTAFRQKLGFADQPAATTFTYKLPTTFVMQLDGRLTNSWFLGAVLKTNSVGQVLVAGPRYESSGADFSITANYNSLSGKVTPGAHLRFAIFTVGSNNLLGLFSKNNTTPVSLFAGISIPVLPKRAKDRDGDYVSDNKDVCPDVKGLWAFRGCPDTDGDGIKDQDDACPNEAGPKETNGCPDADHDGIFDKNDACPNEAGPIKFNGCPDTDGDGVPDKEDECPRVAGLPEFGGCPDTDRDGLNDSQDKCPAMAGLKELSGCPLQSLTQPDGTYTPQENAWLAQLTTDWLAGFSAQSAGFQQAKAWAGLTPKGTILIELSGENQDELLQVATLFRDQLVSELGANSPFKLAVKVRAAQPAGLKITLTK